MGANMARRLVEKGFSLSGVYDVRREAAVELAKELRCAAQAVVAHPEGEAAGVRLRFQRRQLDGKAGFQIFPRA
jgi:3-hydroxyisobutyrate dehydrogenase-like beta-hydroxyacid dehydrogenase